MREVKLEDSLAYKRPDLAKQWNYEKNGDLKPENITCGSERKVWWKCQNGHEWESIVSNRKKGSGCPYCSGYFATPKNCLANVYPNIAKEWHPTKNGDLTPYKATCGSSKKIWWICEKGHEWKTTINQRTSRGSNCPYCSGLYATPETCLATTNPKLSKEWHPTKNGDLTPKDVTPCSHKKVWWLCSKGHEWDAVINSRNRGNGCPKCSKGLSTSLPEQAIFYYVKQVFPDARNRYIYPNSKCEIDIFIPSLNLGIEYDGRRWHKSKERDENKSNFLKEKISLIRVREKGTPILNTDDEIIDVEVRGTKSLEIGIKKIFSYIEKNYFITNIININVNNDRTNIYNMIEHINIENSIKNEFPEIAKEWHPTKNGKLTPLHVSQGSNKKVWWLCSKGHEWQSIVANRIRGDGCPYCSGKKVNMENCLATINPKLAKEWNYKKNNITPNDVTLNSNKKVWWLCSKGHEWESIVANRIRGDGCPYCSGKKVNMDNCLATINPELAKEWHPTKNGNLTPYDVTSGSNKKVWWQCSKGHEWKTAIADRNIGTGCPYCSRRKNT